MRGIPFRIPNIAGNVYAPGPQPSDPGESYLPWAGHSIGARNSPMPWPTMVAVFNLNIGNSGTARMRAPLPVVNTYASLPNNYLFIGGMVGKSQG